MSDDAELLRRYLEEKSEDAFAELVHRHLSLVFHTALRGLGGDAHRAQDVAQSVFIDLARKADKVARHQTLVGWLHTSTRYAAAQAVRTEVRRAARELAAESMIPLSAEEIADWGKLQPVIDDALGELDDRDRAAVLLRFFEGQPFAAIGAALRITEDAARMRVERALDKMRAGLGRRGVTSTSAALALTLAHQGALAAPAGLASTIASAALASTGAGAATAFAFMSTTKMIVASLVVIAGVTALWRQQAENARLTVELAAAQASASTGAALRAENERLTGTIAATQAEFAPLRMEQTASRLAAKGVTPAAETPSASSAPALAKDLKPVGNAGWTTPKAAAETLHWAMNGGDVAAISGAIAFSDSGRRQVDQAFARLPAAKQGEFGNGDGMLANLLGATTQAAGFQVMSDHAGARSEGFAPELATDPAYHTVHVQRQYPDGRVREQDMVFQQGPNGWRWVVPDAVITKLTVEAGAPRPAKARVGG